MRVINLCLGIIYKPLYFRVEAQSKMTMMKEKAEKDLAQYNAEMKELERVIAQEFSLKEFMTTKCSERSEQDRGNEMEHKQRKSVLGHGLLFWQLW